MNETDSEMKLSFLLNGSCNLIPESYVKLRSYLSIYSSKLFELHGVKLPNFLTNRNSGCQFCYTPWKFNCSSFKLLPSSGKRFKNDTRQYSEKEEKFIKCFVCSKKSVYSLHKPAEIKKSQNEELKNKRKTSKKNKCLLDIVQSNKITSKKQQKRSNLVNTITQRVPSKSINFLKNGIKNNKKVQGTILKPTAHPYSYKSKKSNLKKKVCLAALKKAVKEEKAAPKSCLKNLLNVIST